MNTLTLVADISGKIHLLKNGKQVCPIPFVTGRVRFQKLNDYEARMKLAALKFHKKDICHTCLLSLY